MSSVTIRDALERIESTLVKERTEGLADLKHVLRHNQRSSKLDALTDQTFHKVFEVLFRAALGEQSAYVRAKTATLRTSAANRLAACASALRLAVEVGVRSIKLKTVRALLDHINETLPLASGSFCEPLALDYARSLKSLLAYQPHVEHLSRDDWERTAFFCVESVQSAESQSEDYADPGAENQSANGIANGYSYRSSRSAVRDSAASQGMRPLAKQVAEELIVCLRQLTAAPNAPLDKQASALLWAVIGFLRSSSSAGRSHQDAFTAINQILAWTCCEAIQLTNKATSHLLRLIRHYWSPKSSNLRDEMLVTLLRLRPYIRFAMRREDRLTLRSELMSLLEVLRTEYSKRQNRDQLQVDDLSLTVALRPSDDANISRVQNRLVALHSSGPRTEHNWALVHVLVSLCGVLTDERLERCDSDDEAGMEQPKKRQRMADDFEDVLSSTIVPHIGIRTCALQTVTFVLQQTQLNVERLDQVLERLTLCANEDNGIVSSWAYMAVASCACQKHSSHPILAARWTTLWQVAFRAISTSTTSRAACHLMHTLMKLELVGATAVSDFVQTFVSSIDFSGPSVLSDAATRLLTAVVENARQQNPAASVSTAEGALGWLFRNFLPSSFSDKHYISAQNLYEAGDLIEFIHTCISQCANHPQASKEFPVWHHVAQAWLQCEAQDDLVSYLLLLPSLSTMEQSAITKIGGTGHLLASSQTVISCEALLLNFCINEVTRTAELWLQWASERARSISTDMVSFLCKVCCVVSCLSHCNHFRDAKRQSRLMEVNESLVKAVMSFLSSSSCGQDKVDMLLASWLQMLPPVQPSPDVQSADLPWACALDLCRQLAPALRARHQTRIFNGADVEEDLMDVDDNYESQGSGTRQLDNDPLELQNDSSTVNSTLALRSSTSLYVKLISLLDKDGDTSGVSSAASSELVDYITAMPVIEILACRSIVSNIPSLGLSLGVEDTDRLLAFLADSVLRKYAYERSEVATGTILDVMSSLVTSWTDPGNESLFGLGLDMYDWYTSTALSAGVLSPNVQKRVASLLLQLSHVNTDYGKDSDVPSVRTSLFKVLKDGSMAVKYHLAERISTIFSLFVLSAHDAMYDDLQASLPADADWTEGIAMRLLCLAKLASAWHSLLRSCVYHIFETAGQIKSSVPHAAYCVELTARSLGFKVPTQLFTLFAPQLLHTWLERHTLASIPYLAFQYKSFADLLTRNKSEIAAQLFMRGGEQGMHVLTTALDMTEAKLLLATFGKSLAYAISWDISSSVVGSSESPTSEARLRSLLGGKEEFKAQVVQQFPTVMGTFYLTMQQDDPTFEKSIENVAKRAIYRPAVFALREMKAFSSSNRSLPPCQQPSFKSKYLVDQIERLCRRTGQDPVRPWGASSLTLAIRMLLDSVQDALGPLHACLIVRRLRILVSMAGEVALSGFPLELLLQTMRRFLNDSQCADDALGILRYLYSRGKPYMRSAMTFTTGTTTLILLTMRQYMGSQHESTTQESQHQATIKTMQGFHAWLITYLKDSENAVAAGARPDYGPLITAAAHAQLPGNARDGSPESLLLRHLLKDSRRRHPLLTSESRLEALQMLCHDFQASVPVEEDCMGSDQQSVRYAQSVWESIQIPSTDEQYMTWASRVLGRAYSATGPLKLSSAQTRLPLDPGQVNKTSGVSASKTVIAQSLANLMSSPAGMDASLAEYTLRQICTRFHKAKDDEEVLDFEQMLAPSMLTAIADGTYGYEPAAVLEHESPSVTRQTVRQCFSYSPLVPLEQWITRLGLTLCTWASQDPILGALPQVLEGIDGLAQTLLPYVIHILLSLELEKDQVLREELSACCKVYFNLEEQEAHPKQQFLLRVLLYLRTQPLPGESTKADRLGWLDIDFQRAAATASRCSMPTCALLLAESTPQVPITDRRKSRRSSIGALQQPQVSSELLLSVFREVDEPDSFYGVQQQSSLAAVMERIDYEGDGFKSLMFRSAELDSHMRRQHGSNVPYSSGVINSLATLNLNSVTMALLSSRHNSRRGDTPADSLFDTARKLEQWDVSIPEAGSSPTSSLFRVFQDMAKATELSQLRTAIERALLEQVRPTTEARSSKQSIRSRVGALAVLTEVSETVESDLPSRLDSTQERLRARQQWMQLGRHSDFDLLLSSRETLFSTLTHNRSLHNILHINTRDGRRAEVEALVQTASLSRKHGLLQESLAAATHLTEIASECASLGIKVQGAADFEVARVLWEQNESASSIQILRDIARMEDLEQQTIPVGRSGLLAQLGHQLAEARLEKPDEIIERYLKPAIKHLAGRNQGHEAGQVFHEFASFCDQQLQNPGNLEDLKRIAKLRQRKADEVDAFEQAIKSKKSSSEKQELQKSLGNARKWLSIDTAEFDRLEGGRSIFLQQSLENHLLALRACDDYNTSVLRFFAQWLQHSESSRANDVVRRHLPQVSSWKFVLLMNQITSRLQQDQSVFQKSLKALVLRICSEHPHHGVHHIYAMTKTPATKEDSTTGRHNAAKEIASQLSADKRIGSFFRHIVRANELYTRLAIFKASDLAKASSKVGLKDIQPAYDVAKKVPELQVPPVTVTVALRPDGNYKDVPLVKSFANMVSIAGGISAPKILVAHGTDGQQYKQLFKGGNDELRQDAIMEQVFEEVSKMLQNHKATRQRNLHVRTYKVVPLDKNSGIIEFVPNSIPLNDFLNPAHQKYHPTDIKQNAAREHIRNAQDSSNETRVKAYRKVCDHLSPVLRHFFLERFDDPDEWFEKRTAYARTTATISILGHVLGLGDRHGQNILLDECNGEVIHIDLGVAFEAGRVLPIPELVPFRLSRDIVDGMGVTKTEGVFRRCCEFTLDALREDKDSIMTLLNVLRYDPLYSWTVSPLRAKRLQEGQDQGEGVTDVEATEQSSRKEEEEAGEADRALSIVEKKLSKTLSTAATVNELIQQAADERNLAVLFCGWSAWN